MGGGWLIPCVAACHVPIAHWELELLPVGRREAWCGVVGRDEAAPGRGRGRAAALLLLLRCTGDPDVAKVKDVMDATPYGPKCVYQRFDDQVGKQGPPHRQRVLRNRATATPCMQGGGMCM